SRCSVICSAWRSSRPKNGCAQGASTSCREKASLRRNALALLPRRPWLQRDVIRTQQPSVLRIEFELANRLALFPVDENGGDLIRSLVEFLAQLPQGDQDREYAAALRRQQIFLIRAAVGGGRGLQNALIGQRAQPHRENVLG